LTIWTYSRCDAILASLHPYGDALKAIAQHCYNEGYSDGERDGIKEGAREQYWADQ